MPLESSKVSRTATRFTALKVGVELRKASATTAAPRGQDYHNSPADITRLDKNSFSLASPGAIGAGLSIEVSVTVANAQIPVTIDGHIESDLVVLNAPITLEAGLIVGSARITALNTITFRIFNATVAGQTPATNTYLYAIIRS
jgi:hypothetical protein